MLHSYDSSKASHENSSVKLGKSPQQGGGVKNCIVHLPSWGWEMQTGGGGGGGRIFFNISQTKNHICMDYI